MKYSKFVIQSGYREVVETSAWEVRGTGIRKLYRSILTQYNCGLLCSVGSFNLLSLLFESINHVGSA
jgi:hypothetical protein